MTRPRTYAHLESSGRKPSPYEIATSELLPYRSRGFEVTTPVSRWYERYQGGSCITCGDWDKFRDPRETTYATYVAHQAAAEQFMDGVTRLLTDASFGARIGADWLDVLHHVLAPARYVCHGLQMVASYVGSMAPTGRIALASLFQAADQLRLVQLLAYRARQHQVTNPEFGGNARELWEEHPMWQPLREVIERLLVTYDWGEAFIAMNLVVKPIFDDFLLGMLVTLAPSEMRSAYGTLTFTLREDGKWQASWVRALVEVMVADKEENRDAIDEVLARWADRTLLALDALAIAFPPDDAASFARGVAEIAERRRAEWTELGLGAPDLSPRMP